MDCRIKSGNDAVRMMRALANRTVVDLLRQVEFTRLAAFKKCNAATPCCYASTAFLTAFQRRRTINSTNTVLQHVAGPE
jgi:hypothetical protein